MGRESCGLWVGCHWMLSFRWHFSSISATENVWRTILLKVSRVSGLTPRLQSMRIVQLGVLPNNLDNRLSDIVLLSVVSIVFFCFCVDFI